MRRLKSSTDITSLPANTLPATKIYGRRDEHIGTIKGNTSVESTHHGQNVAGYFSEEKGSERELGFQKDDPVRKITPSATYITQSEAQKLFELFYKENFPARNVKRHSSAERLIQREVSGRQWNDGEKTWTERKIYHLFLVKPVAMNWIFFLVQDDRAFSTSKEVVLCFRAGGVKKIGSSDSSSYEIQVMDHTSCLENDHLGRKLWWLSFSDICHGQFDQILGDARSSSRGEGGGGGS
ncbi:MAG: hypothetical protein MMC33_009612 [Icmadophila ericetorum]|nr:hypothetical protein [Icmadophila ericetorum]